jgi:hypothetical protein
MSNSTKQAPIINGKTTLGALAVGLALAPFTGGSSLIYTAVSLGTWSALDVARGNDEATK